MPTCKRCGEPIVWDDHKKGYYNLDTPHPHRCPDELRKFRQDVKRQSEWSKNQVIQ